MAEADSMIAATGVAGLDDILRGGLPRNYLYLVTGTPGTGKTTLAMQFLLEGVRRGETCLYVTLSESKAEIQKVADSHGWDLSKLLVDALVPSERNLSADSQLTVFNPAELELGETTQALTGAARSHQATTCRDRLAVGAAPDRAELAAVPPPGPRAQAVLQRVGLHGPDARRPDGRRRRRSPAEHRARRRRARATGESVRRRAAAACASARCAACRFAAAFTTSRSAGAGSTCFRGSSPRSTTEFPEDDLPSNVAELDPLLGGGLPAGTSTLLLGPAGTGKSTIATQFAVAAAGTRRARGDVRVRREHRHVPLALAQARPAGRQSHGGRFAHRPADRSGRAVVRRIRRRSCAARPKASTATSARKSSSSTA